MLAAGAAALALSAPAAGHGIESPEQSAGPQERWRQTSGSEGPAPASPPPPPGPAAPAPVYPPPPPAGPELGPGGMYPGATTPAPAPIPNSVPPAAPAVPFQGKGDGPDTGRTGG